MKITRANYEVYFLDYLEGNLDEKLVDDFIEFLQNNPDLKEELHQTGSISLEPEAIPFAGKEKLFRERYDQQEEFEKTAVAYIEGDVSVKDKGDFEAYLSAHPEKLKEFELFEKTKLKPDNRIVFRNKNKLYQSSSGKTILLWLTRVAAVLAVAFFVYRFAGDIISSRMHIDNQSTYTENRNENPEPKSLPEKVQKKQDPVPVKEKSHTPDKKAEQKTQPHRSLRESNNGRIDHEKVATTRIPINVPDKIPALQASLQNNERMVASLITINKKNIEVPAFEPEERLLADLVKKKTGLGNISLNKVAKAGLNLVSDFSREKFNYETNAYGQITELNFDSRLLAFSIPTSQN